MAFLEKIRKFRLTSPRGAIDNKVILKSRGVDSTVAFFATTAVDCKICSIFYKKVDFDTL